MALPLSGAISLNDMHIEAGGATGTLATINDADIRGLIGKASATAMSFDEWYGASASTTIQVNLEGGRGGGGDLSGATFAGRGGNTIIDFEITADRVMSITAGGRGGDGVNTTEAGGGGGASSIQMGEPNFARVVAVAGGGGGAAYSNFNGGNAGRGGPGGGTPSSGAQTYNVSTTAFFVYSGGDGFGEADTVSSSGPSGGSSYPGKGGGRGGTGVTGGVTGGLSGTGRYAGAAASTATVGQGGWANMVGGRGGENNSSSTNQVGGGGTLGGIGAGGIGGNAVSASDSGGGGGGGGLNGGGGGSGGAYGSGGGGGGAGYWNNVATAVPSNTAGFSRAGGAAGTRNAAGRVRVYREGVLVNTTAGSGTAAGNNFSFTALF